MNPFVILPVVLPLLAAALGALCFQRERAQRWLASLGIAGQLGAALVLLWQVSHDGLQIMQFGDWAAPFGIVFTADLLGASLAVATGLIGLAALSYVGGDLPAESRKAGFYPLLCAMLAGVSGAFLTGDIFNLYVWFEVLLIGSFGLLVLGGERIQMEGALKYAVLNLLATTLFLMATGLLYGATGTLNMADLANLLSAPEVEAPRDAIALLMLVAFGMKAAAFPLFFWLPASYHTPSATVSAVFAGLLTKVGVYALFRVFTLIMPPAAETLGPLLLAIAGATMIFGILGALAETDLRRALAFMLVSSIGFSLLGLGLGSHAALAAGLFYTWHSMLATTALFLLAGTATQLGGARSLSRLAGLYRADPLLAALFLLAGFAAAGLPPFSGFWGKVFLVRASLLLDQPLLAGIALLAGLLTTIAIARIWALAFWRDQASSGPPAEPSTPAVGMVRIRRMAPAAVLVALLIAIGFWPRPLQSLAEASAGQLLDSDSYIARVLGGSP